MKKKAVAGEDRRDPLLGVRVPAALIKRIDSMAERLDKKSLGTVSRSVVVRVALERGLDVLEREYK